MSLKCHYLQVVVQEDVQQTLQQLAVRRTWGRQTHGLGKGWEPHEVVAVKVWTAESGTQTPGSRGRKVESCRTVAGGERMGNAIIRCTWKWRAWEQGVRWNAACYSSYTALVCRCAVTGWKGSTFLPFLKRCCCVGWLAGMYQSAHFHVFSYIWNLLQRNLLVL